MYKSSVFSTPLPTFVISCLFDTSHPNRYNVIYHCGLDLHFHYIEHFLIYLLDICMSSLKKYLFRSFAHFKVRLLWGFFLYWGVGVSYIIWILTFYDIYDLKIFSSVYIGFLFTLLIVSFVMQKLFVWCSPICLFLFLLPVLLVSFPRKFLQGQCQYAFSLRFLLGVLQFQDSFTALVSFLHIYSSIYHNLVSTTIWVLKFLINMTIKLPVAKSFEYSVFLLNSEIFNIANTFPLMKQLKNEC